MPLVFLLLLLASRSAFGQTIDVTSRDALADKEIGIVVRAVPAGKPVIIRAEMGDAEGRHWRSWAAYRSDASGRIDLSSTSPLHGTYQRPDPTDLLRSMDVDGQEHGRTRFELHGLDPLRVQLSAEIDGQAVATTQLTRRWQAEGVQRIAVTGDGIIGTFFRPAGRPRGAVLVLGGSEGGLSEEPTAALLASHGFAALTIAYFGLPSLPKELSEIPLETFTRALSWLEHEPGLQSQRVGILATSKGSEAALLIAARDTRVRVVVAYAPSSVAWSCICSTPERGSWTESGTAIPFVPPGDDPTYAPPDGFPRMPSIDYRYRLKTASAGAVIPVERIKARLLLIAGDDDQLWPSAEMARTIVRHHKKGTTLLISPGAGHLIPKAILPVGTTLIARGRIDTGGTPSANAAAQMTTWPAALQFLQDNLTAH